MQIEPQNTESKPARPTYLYVGCCMHFVCFVFCLTGVCLTWYDFWNEDTSYDCQDEEGTSASCFQDFEYHGLYRFQVDLNNTITTYQFKDVEDQDVREDLIACGNTALGFASVSIFLLFSLFGTELYALIKRSTHPAIFLVCLFLPVICLVFQVLTMVLWAGLFPTEGVPVSCESYKKFPGNGLILHIVAAGLCFLTLGHRCCCSTKRNKTEENHAPTSSE